MWWLLIINVLSLDLHVFDFKANDDAAVLVRKLYCVRQKVDEDLQVAPLIAHKLFEEKKLILVKTRINSDVFETRVMLNDYSCLSDYIKEVELA